MSAAGPGQSATYQEGHSALNGPLLATGLFGPAAAIVVCAVLGVTINAQWFIGVFVVLFGLGLVPITMVYRNWPTGMRIDESGISIGAVGSRRATQRNPTVSHQSWGVFTVPWTAVEDVRVVTGPAEVRDLKTSPRYYTLNNRWGPKNAMAHCNIGVLTPPFVRAALVIDVDLGAVAATPIRPARFYSNGKSSQFSRLLGPELSPTWVVPTRHPARLGQALEAWLAGRSHSDRY